MNDYRNNIHHMTAEEIIDLINETYSYSDDSPVAKRNGDTVLISSRRNCDSYIEVRAPRKRQWKYKELE